MHKIRRDEGDPDRRIWLFVVAIVIVFCLIFFAASGRFQSPLLSQAAAFVTSPLQRPISYVAEKLSSTRDWLWNIYAVFDQNRELRREVEELRVQNLRAAETMAENARLHELLNYKQTATQFDIVAARVIGRESATWSAMIVIDRGTMHGVRENMPVITSKGLVGSVVEAGPYSAKVRLILDPRAAVGTIVQRPESRVAGIVEGNPGDPVSPRMVNIPKAADIVEGDTIVTSGFGGIYPKGILVGTVSKLEHDASGLLKIASIDAAVDFQKLEDVAVIVASREAPPAPLTPPPQTPGTETDPAAVIAAEKAEKEAAEKAAQEAAAAEAARRQAAAANAAGPVQGQAPQPAAVLDAQEKQPQRQAGAR